MEQEKRRGGMGKRKMKKGMHGVGITEGERERREEIEKGNRKKAAWSKNYGRR